MRHYSLLLAATLAITSLSTGCESWNEGKTPDMDATTQDTTPTKSNGTETSHDHHQDAGTNRSSESPDTSQ